MNKLEKRNFGKIDFYPKQAPFSHDQIEGLRALKKKYARVIAVTGGKGGVGKTNVSINLATAIAQAKFSTLLIDLDLGLANADLLLDIDAKYNLSHVIFGHKQPDEIIVKTKYGPYILPGATGVEELANLPKEELLRLVSLFEYLYKSFDFIIFDTAAGISPTTTTFLPAADEIIIVTIPEPTALIDAYAVIKLLANRNGCGTIHILINMAKSRDEAIRYANSISLTASQLLNINIRKLGYILMDEMVRQAVQKGKPFIIDHPHIEASKCIRQIAERLCHTPIPPAESKNTFIKRLIRLFNPDA